MSTYEKIATILIAILIIGGIAFSYREIREPREAAPSRPGSAFDESLGQEFKIGSFTALVNQHTSGKIEANCDALQPVIIAALHDITEHLAIMPLPTLSTDTRHAFEVNEAALQLFCSTHADATLADPNGNTLVLQKLPFARQGTGDGVGTEVRINATVTLTGTTTPHVITTYGDILIPDRFLDTATSTPIPN